MHHSNNRACNPHFRDWTWRKDVSEMATIQEWRSDTARESKFGLFFKSETSGGVLRNRQEGPVTLDIFKLVETVRMYRP